MVSIFNDNDTEEIMISDFVYYDYLLFFNYALPIIATDKKEIEFIYDKINFFVNTEKSTELRNIAVISLLEKYIFNNKSPFKVQDYLNNIKKSHRNMEDIVCNSYSTVNNFNIFNSLLTSPYLSNEKKTKFFNNLVNNDYYNKFSGNDNKFSLPIFFLETDTYNNYDPSFHYINLIGENEKAFDSKQNLKEAIYDFKENKSFSFILFNIEKNKDVEKLNELVASSIKFFNSCKNSSTNFSEKFKINNFVNELFNSIYKSKFLSNNLSIENKTKSYEIICEIINKTNGKSNKDSFYQTKVNYYCFNKLEKTTELKNSISDIIELMSSDYAIKDEKTIKTIFKNLNLSENLYIQTTYNYNKYINQLIVNSTNSDTNSKTDVSTALNNKFLNFLSIYQDTILNKNIELYDAYLNNVKIIDREKIDLSIKISFEKNNTEEEFNKKIEFLMDNYIKPLVFNSFVKYHTDEVKELQKKQTDDLTCFIKNPFFMLEVFNKTIKGDISLNENNLFHQMFDILNKYIKNCNDTNEKVSFTNFKLEYENKNYNILQIEDNNENRNFLKSYIMELFESKILYDINKNDNSNIYVSFLYFINKSFLHLEEKFPNLLNETFDLLDNALFFRRHQDYIKKLNEENGENKVIEDTNGKYKFLIKNIIKNATSEFEQKINILEISENIVEKIKEIKKISLNF